MKQMLNFDCVVIGGGAAGMAAAVMLAREGIFTAVVEHTKRLGNKLLQTGNGKCNFTNIDIDKQMYQNGDSDYVMQVIGQFGLYDTLEFFKSMGVYARVKNGYVYPHSETAASLQSALRLELEHLGVVILTQTDVLDIIQENDNHYVLKCIDAAGERKNISSQCVLLAAGSKASPKTGSDGSGYQLAKRTGHRIVKPLPALVQLVSSDPYCKVASGVRSRGSVSVFVDRKKVAEDIGEIQYTDYGISGIPVFQVSRYAVRAKDEKKAVSAVVNMLPDISDEQLRQESKERFLREGYKTIEEFFQGILNKKLVQMASKKADVAFNVDIKSLGIKQVNIVMDIIKHYTFVIDGAKGFDCAQVCQGGVDLRDVSLDMQSRILKGLYFAGEILDVDGKCGGYNLQWAWSSAGVAAKSIIHRLKGQPVKEIRQRKDERTIRFEG